MSMRRFDALEKAAISCNMITVGTHPTTLEIIGGR